MLRWPGDYTLQRFRAKLAEKNHFDPSVEPDYEEVWIPELGERVITKKVEKKIWNEKGVHKHGKRLGHIKAGDIVTPAQIQQLASLDRKSNDEVIRVLCALDEAKAGGLNGSASYGSLNRSLSEAGRQTSTGSPSRSMRMSSSAGSLPRAQQQQPSLGVKRIESRLVTRAPQKKEKMEPKEAEMAEREKVASSQLWSLTHGHVSWLQKDRLKWADEGRSKFDPVESLYACKQGELKDAKVDWKNDQWDGATLLIKAIRNGEKDLAQYLLDTGADAKIADNSKRGPVHWAAMHGEPTMLALILEKAPDLPVDTCDDGGDQPLHLAAFSGSLPLVRMLIQRGADAEVPNSQGFLPWQLARARKQWHIERYLKDNGALELDSFTLASETPLTIVDTLRPCDWVAKMRLAEKKENGGLPVEKPTQHPDIEEILVRNKITKKLIGESKTQSIPQGWFKDETTGLLTSDWAQNKETGYLERVRP